MLLILQLIESPSPFHKTSAAAEHFTQSLRVTITSAKAKRSSSAVCGYSIFHPDLTFPKAKICAVIVEPDNKKKITRSALQQCWQTVLMHLLANLHSAGKESTDLETYKFPVFMSSAVRVDQNVNRIHDSHILHPRVLPQGDTHHPPSKFSRFCIYHFFCSRPVDHQRNHVGPA